MFLACQRFYRRGGGGHRDVKNCLEFSPGRKVRKRCTGSSTVKALLYTLCYLKSWNKIWMLKCWNLREPVVGSVTRHGLKKQEILFRFPAQSRGFPCSKAARPTLGSPQPDAQWVPAAHSPAAELPVPRLRICEGETPLPCISSWRTQ